MKVHEVKAAQKDQGLCEVCKESIAVGQSYKYLKDRTGPKRSRHMTCRHWLPSEIAAGSKIAVAYAAQEAAHEELDGLGLTSYKGDPSGFVTRVGEILEECATTGGECRDDYQEGFDNLPQHFQEASTGQAIAEKIEALEGWVEGLENWESTTIEPAEGQDFEVWADVVMADARATVDALEV